MADWDTQNVCNPEKLTEDFKTFKKGRNKRIWGAPERQMKRRKGSSSPAFSGDTTAYSPTSLVRALSRERSCTGGNSRQHLPSQRSLSVTDWEKPPGGDGQSPFLPPNNC